MKRSMVVLLSAGCIMICSVPACKTASPPPARRVAKKVPARPPAVKPSVKIEIEEEKMTYSPMVGVQGGSFAVKSGGPISVSGFNIDKYEVTHELWTEVRRWAQTNGYPDLPAGLNGYNPVGQNNPVIGVSWSDAVKWCNARSERYGLEPVYYTDKTHKNVFRRGTLKLNPADVKWEANGYRLPTVAEWEFAARGGNASKGYNYSGSNDLGEVAWHSGNADSASHPVGQKKPNELGIHDMSGNALEWCWDWAPWKAFGPHPPDVKSDPRGPATTQVTRVLRGGSVTSGSARSYRIETTGTNTPDNRYVHSVTGFRCVQGGPFVLLVQSLPTGQGTKTGERARAVPVAPRAVRQSSHPGMVGVVRGTFKVGLDVPITVSDFDIDMTEVTFDMWTDVRKWGLAHGYTDLPEGQNGVNPVGPRNPVTRISWYDAVKWCNARSEKSGLPPVYYTDRSRRIVYRTGQIDISNDAVDWNGGGYRLPTEAEWEFAARGGNASKGYSYSGSNKVEEVAWYNIDDATHTVGQKKANELGLHDMSGNLLELCWDWTDNAYPSGGSVDPKGPDKPQQTRRLRGGSYEYWVIDPCRVDGGRVSTGPSGRNPTNGFRCVVRPARGM